MKNTGFDLEREKKDRSVSDYVLGSTIIEGLADKVAGLVIALFAWPVPGKGVYPARPHGKINHCVIFFQKLFEKFFPMGELQRGKEDFMDCVTRGFLNEVEKQFNYLIKEQLLSQETTFWLRENGYLTENGVEFSDRFNAILSGTTKTGNSLKGVINNITNVGLIPKSMLPAKSWMSWSQYHNAVNITQEMLDLGLEFQKRISINYAIVYKSNFAKYAGNVKWEIFDNYVDKSDGDWVKRLAPDYKFLSYGYQIFINEIKGEEIEKPMKLYKTADKPEIYQKGVGSGLYHHILDWNTFYSLYGALDKVDLEVIAEIKEEEMGEPIGLKSTFRFSFLNFFNKLRGNNK